MKNLGVHFFLLAAGTLNAAPVVPWIKASPASVHVFDDRPASIHLEVKAPIGTGGFIRADVWQVASGIAAPLSADLKIADVLEFNDRTFVIVPASIPLPKVKYRSELRVRFRLALSGNEEMSVFCEARMFVYPKSLPATLKELPARLAVLGDSPSLRAFLNGENIPFTDAGSALPMSAKEEMIYLTENNVSTRWPEGLRVIVFSTESDLAPGIYSRESQAGFIIKVTLPILDDLSTNPLSREIFAGLLQAHP